MLFLGFKQRKNPNQCPLPTRTPLQNPHTKQKQNQTKINKQKTKTEESVQTQQTLTMSKINVCFRPIFFV